MPLFCCLIHSCDEVYFFGGEGVRVYSLYELIREMLNTLVREFERGGAELRDMTQLEDVAVVLVIESTLFCIHILIVHSTPSKKSLL